MPLRFHHHQLPNGLTVVAEVDGDAHTAAVGFFVKTGTRDEAEPLMGVSHFLEHMMFKGTARRTADDVNREFDDIGANYNAYTSQENTVYWAHVLPQFLARAVDLLGDMMRPALREDDFGMEKNVILEEIEMYQDRPHWRLQDAMTEEHFAPHPLAYRVLGTPESVAALKVDQMRSYFQQRYSPDNITIAAAGQLDFAALIDDVAKLAGDWAPTGAGRTYQEPGLTDGQLNLTDPKLTRHYMAMICPGPSAQDPRRYAANVVTDVVGDAEGSRLYWALVDPGLADEADLSCVCQDQTGSYVAFASCDPQRAEEVEKLLLKTIDAYAASVDADEIERAKNKIATQATLSGESPGGRMRGLGGQWTYLGQYIPLAEEIDRIIAVTPQEVRDLVTALPFQPRTIARLGPA